MIFYSLLTLILLSPLPLALNRSWSWSLWAVVVGLIATTWAVKIIRQPHQTISLRHIGCFMDILCLFIAVLGWIVLQSSAISPFAAHSVWFAADSILPVAVNHATSVTPDDTITSCMRLLSYALVFCLTLFYGQDRGKARIVLMGLMVAGALYSLHKIFIYINDLEDIHYFPQWTLLYDLSSTIVNNNHFAAYAGLTLLCTVSLLSEEVIIATKDNNGEYLGQQRFIHTLIVRTVIPLGILLTIGTALVLSNSRGGFFGFLFALSVLLIAMNINHRARGVSIVWLLGFVVLFGGFLFYLSGADLLQRLDKEGLSSPARQDAYQSTWDAIMTNPWLGYGLGSFEEMFATYKNTTISGTVRRAILWNYAHNVYLETIFEIGIPAAGAFFYCFFKMAWICGKGLLQRKRDWMYPALGLAATCLIGLQSATDFGMQMPAIAYTYALLMGVACAQSFSYPKRKRSTS